MKRYKLPKLKLGDVVAVQFLDHCENAHDGGSDEPLPFFVFGKVGAITKRAITVDCWCYVDKTAARDCNVQSYTVVKTAILDVKILGSLS
jgi:hypothetical protein